MDHIDDINFKSKEIKHQEFANKLEIKQYVNMSKMEFIGY